MTLRRRAEILRDYELVNVSRQASSAGPQGGADRQGQFGIGDGKSSPRWPWPSSSATAIGAAAITSDMTFMSHRRVSPCSSGSAQPTPTPTWTRNRQRRRGDEPLRHAQPGRARRMEGPHRPIQQQSGHQPHRRPDAPPARPGAGQQALPADKGASRLRTHLSDRGNEVAFRHHRRCQHQRRPFGRP